MRTALAVALGLAAALPGLAAAQDLVIWHDKADPGIAMIEQMAAAYRRDHPQVTIRSISMPTDQWMQRTVAALNTNTAPDIIFNDNDRMVEVQRSTGKLSDLAAVLAGLPPEDRANLSAGDIGASSFQGRLIQMPLQRVVVGLGVRRSWLSEAGESFPRTWDDLLRVAGRFREQHRDAFPIALHAGSAGGMIGSGIALLAYGNGAQHVLVDQDGNIVIDRPEVARPLVEYLKLFTQYQFVSREAVNWGFVDLYQQVEGGRAGMFRVGNWNVARWDRQPPAGDYEIGPYPSFGNGPGHMIVATIRGMAVPENARNRQAAQDFLRFIVSRPAQQISLDTMGGSIRADLDTANVTPGLRPFLNRDVPLQTDDFLNTVFPWYGRLQDSYYRILVETIANPPADWDAWVAATAARLRTEVAALRR
jgi:ABC-type glycerol-3-phosphate transport system substrate-binding protein